MHYSEYEKAKKYSQKEHYAKTAKSKMQTLKDDYIKDKQ